MNQKRPKDGSTLATCSYEELLRFRRDHVSYGACELSLCDYPWITISAGTQSVSMHRTAFNRLIRGYIKGRVFIRKPIKP